MSYIYLIAEFTQDYTLHHSSVGVVNVSNYKLKISGGDNSGKSINGIRIGLKYRNGYVDWKDWVNYNAVDEIKMDFGLLTDQMVTPNDSYAHNIVIVYYQFRYFDETYSSIGSYAVGSAFSYSKPNKYLFNVYRNSISTTTLSFELNIQCVSLIPETWTGDTNEYNLVKYKRQYKNEAYDWIDIDAEFVPISGLLLDSLPDYDLPFLTDNSYTIRLIVQDIGGYTYFTDTLPTSAIVMTWGKDGVGFGKIWERGALDIAGTVYKNNHLQPTIYQKKVSDPDPEGMEDGDLLVIYNDIEEFESVNFPQNFGTGYVWGQQGEWPTLFLYWTSASSISNTIIESFECSAFKGSGYPLFMFDGNTEWDNNYMIPIEAAPLTVILHFKGKVKFNSFTLYGWMQSHEIKNAPKSFAFFGSNDGHTWISLYDTTEFPDTYGTSASADMLNSGVYYEYLKMVWRTNQDDNAGVDGTMIAIRELTFDVSGYKYV